MPDKNLTEEEVIKGLNSLNEYILDKGLKTEYRQALTTAISLIKELQSSKEEMAKPCRNEIKERKTK